jgi:hypothetical protein
MLEKTNLKFLAHPQAFYFYSSDLILTLNKSQETACVPKVLAPSFNFFLKNMILAKSTLILKFLTFQIKALLS